MKSDEIEKIPLQQVDTELVRYALQDASWMVIDTRDPDTFNGWCLGGEKVKGHIAGATDYSAQWIRFPYINPWTTEEEYRSRFGGRFEILRYYSQSRRLYYMIQTKMTLML